MAFPQQPVDLRSPRWGRLGFASKRASVSFSVPAEELGQPQDGAQSAEEVAPRLSASGIREPEDARLTGGTRSLMRRVLGLNVTSAALRPMRPAGVHPVKTVLGSASAA